MRTYTPTLTFVAAAAIATLAFMSAGQAASPADGQPAATGAMDHCGMGMDHSGMGMDHSGMGMDHSGMGMDHSGMSMDHGGMGAGMDHAKPSDGEMHGMMQQHQQMMARMHGQSTQAGVPTLPGQDAFGAVQEIVRVLEADPKTDWSKIDLEALRQHLIDMNDVTLQADVSTKAIEGGLEIAVTGSGRTLAAIRRMVPAHASEINGLNSWEAKTSVLDSGVLLTVTASDPKEVAHIRGLGFIGILVSGSHHQLHHLAMAKGEPIHGAAGEHAQHGH
jgi:hypothetical protein